MASLYEAGWRQGTIVDADLPLDAVVLNQSSGQPERRLGRHNRWAVASQNCDLDLIDESETDPCIEIRPVFQADPPRNWGIRSSRFLLTETEYVEATSPRPIVAPAVLTSVAAGGAKRRLPSEARQLAFTTWLGLRYDRPAVPPGLLPLAKRIAELVRSQRNRHFAIRVRDVLMQFGEAPDVVRFSLFAVLQDEGDEQAAREWLSEVARAVPADLGVADQIEAATASGISFQVIETSYAADVTQLTWRPGSPEPEGAG